MKVLTLIYDKGPNQLNLNSNPHKMYGTHSKNSQLNLGGTGCSVGTIDGEESNISHFVVTTVPDDVVDFVECFGDCWLSSKLSMTARSRGCSSWIVDSLVFAKEGLVLVCLWWLELLLLYLSWVCGCGCGCVWIVAIEFFIFNKSRVSTYFCTLFTYKWIK